MNRTAVWLATFILPVVLLSVGCRSPYRSDQGALFGGLLGAGTGAIVGSAVGNAGAGAAIGAGVGALTGAAVGDELDRIDAQNRVMIEQRLGRQLAAGAVSMDDVAAMTAAGVDDELIVSHIRTNGVAAPPKTEDVIFLHKQGVSTRVIKALQEPPQPVAGQPVPAPVIIEEHHYGPPMWWGPPCRPRHYPRHHRHSPGVSWGVSMSN